MIHLTPDQIVAMQASLDDDMAQARDWLSDASIEDMGRVFIACAKTRNKPDVPEEMEVAMHMACLGMRYALLVMCGAIS